VSEPLSPERLAEIRERLAAIDGPWSPILEAEDYVQVWRTAALRDVHHDADGKMIAWSAPGIYKPTDLVAEWDLDDANEGDDDLRDRRAWFIAHAPDDLADLLTEVEQLRAKDEKRHVELRDKRTDLLGIRGILKPADRPNVVIVPMELGEKVAPAVEHLAKEVEQLRAFRDDAAQSVQAVVSGELNPDEALAEIGRLLEEPGGES
jgi:hypothetical protein